MDSFKEILNDIVEYKKVNKRLSIGLIRDLALITCLRLKNKFMILPTTKRNIEFVENVSSLYNLNIYDENKNISDERLTSLLLYIERILKVSISVEEAFNKISTNTIILEKNNDLLQHIEAMRIGNLLSGDKKFSIKEISFYGGRKPNMTYTVDGLSKKLTNANKMLNENIKFNHVSVGQKNTFELEIEITKKLSTEFDKSYLSNIDVAKDFRDKLNNEVKQYIIDNFILSHNTIIVKDVDIYLSLKEIKEIGNIKYNVRKLIGINNVFFKKQTRELRSKVRIKNIPFDEMINIIDVMVFNKDEDKIKELLIK